MSKACAGRASEQPLYDAKIDRRLCLLVTANRFDQNGTRLLLLAAVGPVEALLGTAAAGGASEDRGVGGVVAIPMRRSAASSPKVGLRLLLAPLSSNVVIRTVSCAVGGGLPVYSTFRAIEKKDQKEKGRWLLYWAAYGSFSIAEAFADQILSRYDALEVSAEMYRKDPNNVQDYVQHYLLSLSLRDEHGWCKSSLNT
ncbi:hypothetical protein ABZP36_023059 [Zizania latifolia]